METGLHIILSCPHVTGYLSANDYVSFEIALSKYLDDQNTNKLINNSCKLAFKNLFYENVNQNQHHLLQHSLKPIIGETYKHLWFYINYLQKLNKGNNNENNDISQTLTIFEIYLLISFHFRQTNVEYIIHLLNINQNPSKLNNIINILNQFLSKISSIRTNYNRASTLLTLSLNNVTNKPNKSNNTMREINVIYREYSISHLLSVLGDYDTASISINVKSSYFPDFPIPSHYKKNKKCNA